MADWIQFNRNHHELFRVKSVDPSSKYDHIFLPLFVGVAFACMVLLIMLFEVFDEEMFPSKKNEEELLAGIQEEGEEEEEEYSTESEGDSTDLLNEVIDEVKELHEELEGQITPEESKVAVARPLEELSWHKGCSKQRIQVKMPKINPVSDETYKKMILKMSRLENSINTINGNLESVLKLH